MRILMSILTLLLASGGSHQAEAPKIKPEIKEPTPLVEMFNEDDSSNNSMHVPVFHISLFDDGRIVVKDSPKSEPRTLFATDLFVKRVVMDAEAFKFHELPTSLTLKDDLRPIVNLRIVKDGTPHTVRYSVIRGREVMEFVDKEPGERPTQMRIAYLLGERVYSVGYFAR